MIQFLRWTNDNMCRCDTLFVAWNIDLSLGVDHCAKANEAVSRAALAIYVVANGLTICSLFDSVWND